MKKSLPLEWVKKINPNYWETLLEGEEIMFGTLWNFDDLEWNEKNANIARECNMIPVEVDGLLYVGLGACGMDLDPIVIYTQYKLTDWIEPDDVAYLKYKDKEYVKYVLDDEKADELYKAVKEKKFT